jgi:5-methyltetrahydropteroyltriglutamate--homocysteine methyltransferase
VQSYGSRCVRPPLLYGDVARRGPMSVREVVLAQSLTDRPVKGMLSGPITMLRWSFVRADLPAEQVATQLALIARDEAVDLEAAGIAVVQVDEPAFREGLPLRRAERDDYLRWAVRAFRIATAGVRPDTQIHTHMCYSDFGDVLPAIAALDADVLSVEDARSGGAMARALREAAYGQEIGPGVYDVHSPAVPTVEQMLEKIRASLASLPPERVWVNPDCGLKTRRYAEVVPALTAMVEAARRARATAG